MILTGCTCASGFLLLPFSSCFGFGKPLSPSCTPARAGSSTTVLEPELLHSAWNVDGTTSSQLISFSSSNAHTSAEYKFYTEDGRVVRLRQGASFPLRPSDAHGAILARLADPCVLFTDDGRIVRVRPAASSHPSAP
eukprot:CAMPEP_0113662356 /NCGR_PEP_ID=MMETSP0038_2-20120614/523_1 /TAXON_ID=2898 /ORGANISM="Cryptomonas paramecium" /LENGTH=136 /DNA_ID=CAMNT_0000577227 /DNA_START=520 /DNA_END=927 /DNA_ORIENTATION=- /assembly_acc=CAM_ASM_000170